MKLRHFDNCQYVIIVCSNGNIIVGGRDTMLKKYHKKGKLIALKDIGSYVDGGLSIDKHLYCFL